MAWPSNSDTSIDRDTAILAWREAKTELDRIKAHEMEMRKQLTELLFPTPKAGTQRFDLGNGYAIKLVHKLNYKLDKERVEDALDQIEKQGPVGELIAQRLVKFDPILSQTEYKQLGEVDKKIIDAVLTIEPASPTLELEEPK